jgi:hypothetical protein
MKNIDFFFNKVLPKKFIVFTIATVGLFLKLITGDQWVTIAWVYLGVNVVKGVITLINDMRKSSEKK